MRTVFGIDVSKASSEVAILVIGERVHGYTMSNDIIGFSRLLIDLKTVSTPRNYFRSYWCLFSPTPGFSGRKQL